MVRSQTISTDNQKSPIVRRVFFVSPDIRHYRTKFHDLVLEILAKHSIEYNLIYSNPHRSDLSRKDVVDLPWAILVKSIHFGRSGRITWQNALKEIRGADLVVIGQENRFLINYILQLLPGRVRPRLAFWGHGRNFQARNRASGAERWKSWWATRVDWWFAYTDESRRHIENLSFPPERITVLNNSIDTSELRRQIGAATPDRLSSLSSCLGLQGRHIGIFVGGLYPDKRVDFLVAASDYIRTRVIDFELIVVGGGTDLPFVKRMAETRPWMKVMGPCFGPDTVDLMMLGHVFLMPGLVGLAILDAGMAGLPIATTAFPWHSPEIAYLENGRNGLIVTDWQSPVSYGEAVAELLTNPSKLEAMRAEAQKIASQFSIERMADNFANGIIAALGKA